MQTLANLCVKHKLLAVLECDFNPTIELDFQRFTLLFSNCTWDKFCFKCMIVLMIGVTKSMATKNGGCRRGVCGRSSSQDRFEARDRRKAWAMAFRPCVYLPLGRRRAWSCVWMGLLCKFQSRMRMGAMIQHGISCVSWISLKSHCNSYTAMVFKHSSKPKGWMFWDGGCRVEWLQGHLRSQIGRSTRLLMIVIGKCFDASTFRCNAMATVDAYTPVTYFDKFCLPLHRLAAWL